jgi:MFS family permease
MLAIVRGDYNFRRFLIARVLSSFAAMGEGFLTVAVVRQWAVSDSTVGYFTAAMLLGQTGGNLLAGFVADRWGHKLSLELGYLGLIVSFGLAWLAPGPAWYFIVFAVLGFAAGSRIVSGVLIPLEFAQAEHRPSYVGISNTTMGVGSAVAPLVGGLLAWFSYDLLFAVSALLGLAAFVSMRWGVAEPRRNTPFDPASCEWRVANGELRSAVHRLPSAVCRPLSAIRPPSPHFRPGDALSPPGVADGQPAVARRDDGRIGIFPRPALQVDPFRPALPVVCRKK